MVDSALEKEAAESTLILMGNDSILTGPDAVKAWLRNEVYRLLNHDFNKLVSILYRIDVYESKAKECFGKQNTEIADCLADLIWQRQIEKAERKKRGG